MKKFLFILMAAFAITAAAHTTDNGIFDNTYVTVKGGATALTQPINNGYEDWAHSIQAAAGLQIGKWITPHWGAAIDGTMGIRNGSKLGAFQDYGVHVDLPDWADAAEPYFNKINYVTVSALAKYRIPVGNFNIVAAAGPSWIHGFSYVNDHNDIGTKFQVELNYDINNKFALTLVPEFNYNFTANAGNQPKFNATTSWYGVMAGITYKIRDGFTECTYAYTQEEVDALNATINELRNREPEKVVERVVEDHVVVKNNVKYANLLFEKGSAELTAESKAQIAMFDGPIDITGCASPEGSAEFNKKLAQDRANAVAEYAKSIGKQVRSINVGPLGSRVVTVKQ